jgi:hypothetical protein
MWEIIVSHLLYDERRRPRRGALRGGFNYQDLNYIDNLCFVYLLPKTRLSAPPCHGEAMRRESIMMQKFSWFRCEPNPFISAFSPCSPCPKALRRAPSQNFPTIHIGRSRFKKSSL